MDTRISVIKEGELGCRPSWDEYIMYLAIGASTRASCHNVHAGCILTTPNHEIIGTGYNGAPSLIKENCLQAGCAKKNKGLDYHDSLNSGECIGIHSEMNATGHLTKIVNSGINVYTTIFPCHTCAKELLKYLPRRIIYKRDYSEKEMPSTLDMLLKRTNGKVEIYQLDMSPRRYIDITFNHPNVLFDVWSKEEKERILRFLTIYNNL